MRVLAASDKFKGTASAAQVCAAIGHACWNLNIDCVEMPMADGGEGTIDAFAAAVPGSRVMPVTVSGPIGEPVDTHWLLLPAQPGAPTTAVVELAATSGITLLDPLAPLDAHSRGFGEAIAAALDHGVGRVLLAIGGSASTDGGAGMLAALGAELLGPRARSNSPVGLTKARFEQFAPRILVVGKAVCSINPARCRLVDSGWRADERYFAGQRFKHR